jgi:hypothetical protein
VASGEDDRRTVPLAPREGLEGVPRLVKTIAVRS